MLFKHFPKKCNKLRATEGLFSKYVILTIFEQDVCFKQSREFLDKMLQSLLSSALRISEGIIITKWPRLAKFNVVLTQLHFS